MLNEDLIKTKIKKLVEAENDSLSDQASDILSKEFIAITRSTGIEEDKNELINRIKAGSGGVRRELSKKHFKVHFLEKVALSRSIIIIKDKEGEERQYRNIHVFENKNGD